MENSNKSIIDKTDNDIEEKIINGSMTGDEIVETVYSQPDPKPYD